MNGRKHDAQFYKAGKMLGPAKAQSPKGLGPARSCDEYALSLEDTREHSQ